MRLCLLSTVFLGVLATSVAAHRHHVDYGALPDHAARPTPDGWVAVASQVISLQQTFEVTIGLHRRNVELVRSILHKVSDPSDEHFGDHLTPEALRALVAPPMSNVNQVTAWLAREGVTSVQVSANSDSVSFTATAQLIEKIFDVKFATYVNTRSNVKLSRALGQVYVPTSLHSIVEVVVGFRAFPVEKTLTRIKTSVTGDDDDITPQVIFRTYNISSVPAANSKNAQGFFQAQGQYVDPKDLTKFCKKYFKDKHCSIAKYVGRNDGGDPGLESCLDSQYIMGVNDAEVSTWAFSYPNFDFCSDLIRWGSDVLSLENSTRPYVISMSYGTQSLPSYCSGADVSRLSDDMMLMGAVGITVIISSGDSGSGQYSRMGYNNGKLNPSWPASIPYCVAVGSTTFVSGNEGEEKATDEFGSGGGFSFDYNVTSQFSYQTAAVDAYFRSGVKMPGSHMYPRNGRATPDVGALGWNFNVVDGGSWSKVGGTSASAPTFAAIVSILNNERLKVGKTMGLINPFLYQNPGAFNDVVKGSNAVDPNTIGWECAKGWDPVTGLGTPNVGLLLDAVKKLNAKDIANNRK